MAADPIGPPSSAAGQPWHPASAQRRNHSAHASADSSWDSHASPTSRYRHDLISPFDSRPQHARHASATAMSTAPLSVSRTASPRPSDVRNAALSSRPLGAGRARAGTLPSRFSGAPSTTRATATPNEWNDAGWRFPSASPLLPNDTFAPMFSSVPELAQPDVFEPFVKDALPKTSELDTLDTSSLDQQANGLAKTLDFLGLDEGALEPQEVSRTPAAMRERANTDAALYPNNAARASIAPGGPVRPSLLPRAGSETRASTLSVSSMQAHRPGVPMAAYDGPYNSNTDPIIHESLQRISSEKAGTSDYLDRQSTPQTPNSVAKSHSASPTPSISPAYAPGHGRHRADTIGALNGSEARLRTEDTQSLNMPSNRDKYDPFAPLPNRLRSMTMPNRASGSTSENLVYISRLSAQASSRILLRLFEPYGAIEDIVLFPRHNGAVIQFSQAHQAKDACEAGMSYVGPYLVELLAEQRIAPLFSLTEASWAKPHSAGRTPPFSAETENTPPRLRRNATSSIVPSSDRGGVPLPTEHKETLALDEQRAFGHSLHFRTGSDPSVDSLETSTPRNYHATIPPVHDSGKGGRRFDNARFRELRKNMENGQMTQTQVDNVAMDCLDVIVELASNYIGNTVVQRFFEQCSESVKTNLLQRLAPHLATIGCHKNGTWAAQKIIDRANTDEQKDLIAEHLQPYVPALLLDQYGNYVVQCVLPFGFPRATFILDAMVDRCWEIAQGRFGARSMRTVLEHPSVPRQQLKRVAMAIILNCVPLATSANGSLLLTWLLDTSNLDGVMMQIAPRFVPHIASLATHKLASVTVLRIIGRSTEPEAGILLLRAIFDLPQAVVLKEILLDLVHGSQLIAKALQSPIFPQEAYMDCIDRVATILVHHQLANAPAYRRLAEQVGLAPSSPPAGIARCSPPSDKTGKIANAAMDSIPPAMMLSSYGIYPNTPYSFETNGPMYMTYAPAMPSFDIHSGMINRSS
ncbi:hypothetical protein MPSI1_001174 [Malassezia psittaci]|uniref:PUM-HD domain-containing protein n=1 Tax=Malassezia psittaci TaxID=1821823 RepID=A0AAF0F9S5_9BASI|nr:hypothetical protein MPSI1_001174 [Malassezia psittaci]